MKFKFWASLCFSVLLPLLVVFGWGLHFTRSYEHQTQEKILRENLKQNQPVYLKSFKTKKNHLIKKAGHIFRKGKIESANPFFALITVRASQKKPIKKYFSKNKKFLGNWRDIQKQFPSWLKENKINSQASLQLHTFSLNSKKKMIMVILDGKHFFKKRDQFIVGFLKDPHFFKMTQNASQEDLKNKEILLVNNQGQLIFHNDPQYLFKVLSKKSSLRPFISFSYSDENKGRWMVKKIKKQSQLEMSYIQKLKGTDTFLILKESFQPDRLFLSAWGLKWGIFCLSIFLMIFFGLIFTISPLFSAYQHLKSFFIHFFESGEMPTWGKKIKNPFLYFYHNRNIRFTSPKSILNSANAPATFKTFQSVLIEEVKKLKFKYPGLKVKEKLKSNIKLWQFEGFMRTILRELLFNAVESMGANEIQDVIISSWEENERFVFSIKDKGAGLLEEEHNKAFQLYYSTKSQLGVGLNLAQSIVNSNNGIIEFLTSNNQQGLEVVVKLPMKCFFNPAELKSQYSSFLKKGNQFSRTSL